VSHTFQELVGESESKFFSAISRFCFLSTDNGHTRDGKYASSLRQYYPYDKYSGKYTNGKVGVEWMVEATTSPALKRSRTGAIALQDCESLYSLYVQLLSTDQCLTSIQTLTEAASSRMG